MPTASCPSRSGLVLDDILDSARTSAEHQPLASTAHAALQRVAPHQLLMCCWRHTLCVLLCVGALLCWRQGLVSGGTLCSQGSQAALHG
jgi:hypothetical protein